MCAMLSGCFFPWQRFFKLVNTNSIFVLCLIKYIPITKYRENNLVFTSSFYNLNKYHIISKQEKNTIEKYLLCPSFLNFHLICLSYTFKDRCCVLSLSFSFLWECFLILYGMVPDWNNKHLDWYLMFTSNKSQNLSGLLLSRRSLHKTDKPYSVHLHLN